MYFGVELISIEYYYRSTQFITSVNVNVSLTLNLFKIKY